MKSSPLYLDYASTTPVDPRVLETMLPYLTEKFGNAASTTHLHGEEARKAVERASYSVAHLINAQPEEIVYTSGSTESINTALKGLFWSHSHARSHIVTVKTEHKAVLDTCHWLEQIGATVTYLNVDHDGIINWEEYYEALRLNPLLVCVMHANNETGVVQEIGRIAQVAKENGAYFMTDATQSFGKIDIDVLQSNVDLLCFSAHKIYGPKGVGGLFIKAGVKLTPLIHGGGHQQNYRSGTLNVPGIVALGKAAEIASEEMKINFKRLSKTQKDFEGSLLQNMEIIVNGASVRRVPNISSIQFQNMDAEEFIVKKKHLISVSTGSACTSAIIEPSHVLEAMGVQANKSIRFSFTPKHYPVFKELFS